MHERLEWEQGKKAEAELEYWKPGQVIQNYIRIEAGHTVGKTKLASGLFSHFFDCFIPSIIYTFAPSAQQIKDLLWKEIGTDRIGNNLPGRVLETCEIKTGRKDWFAKGRATNDANGRGTEKVHGQHGPFLMFILDEAEGIPKFVFDAVDSMAFGGIVIVILLANPRTRTSEFHKIRTRANVKNFRISCLHHPNVKAGREIVPNAVRREYVTGMIEAHCEAVHHALPDSHTFTLPFEATKNGITFPPQTVWLPDTEYCFRVLGIAPSNNSDNTFCPVGRYEAAKNRIAQSHNPAIARMGVDVARFGNDFGTVYVRHNGSVWRGAFLSKLDSVQYKEEIKRIARELKELGVKSLHIRVDGGGGFGGGVIDQLRRDAELRAIFPDFMVFEVHNNGVPRREKNFKNLGTEMYAEAAESLKTLALVRPPDLLEVDLCERTYDWVNVKGVDVKVLAPKDEFKKAKGHSPDDGDGFVLAVAPDFLFVAAPARHAAGGTQIQTSAPVPGQMQPPPKPSGNAVSGRPPQAAPVRALKPAAGARPTLNIPGFKPR